MSKVRLTFVAKCGAVGAGGSLVLDTTTQHYTDVLVVCTGGHLVDPKVSYKAFAPPPPNYPPGTPTVINIGDPKGVVVQMDYAIHGSDSPAIPITGGYVEGVPFSINVQGAQPGTGAVVVTPEP